MNRSDAELILQELVGNPRARFRSGQWEAIDALVNRRSKVLVVQRTGWGKSSVYFSATKILRKQDRGLTLIISPLLALMRNQIEMANGGGLNVRTINSSNKPEWEKIEVEIADDRIDALLISPERLADDKWVSSVLEPLTTNIGLIVVDEAHCISDWGHDFRPDYRRIVNLLRSLPPNVPVLATTATANRRVIADIRTQLGDLEIQRGPLIRKSIALQNLRLDRKEERQAWILNHIDELPGTGIIYALTRPDVESLANFLQQNGVNARPYHSKIENPEFSTSDEYRQHLEDLLFGNKIKALVATSALGMGYDKPDLGFVVHYQAPGSIISYYQQVGRAARAIEYAVGVLMTGAEDGEIQEYFRTSSFPHNDLVQRILDVLSTSDGLSAPALMRHVNLSQSRMTAALKYLSVEQPSPVIKDDKVWKRTAVAYELDQEKIRRLVEKRTQEWDEIQRYVDEKGCLMKFLANSLDDKDSSECGKCENCLGKPIVDTAFAIQDSLKASELFKLSDVPLTCRKRFPKDVLKHYRFGKTTNIPQELRAEEGRVLSSWNDVGWGHSVREGKRNGRFDEHLVDAMAELLNDRWCPQPDPKWITCVPSTRHPTLVPNFATELSRKLGIPFKAVVHKVQENRAQKEQQVHRVRNLDGAFMIDERLPEGPVFLFDDVVDSKWTLTVIAALLRQRGSGPVFPIALTDASSKN